MRGAEGQDDGHPALFLSQIHSGILNIGLQEADEKNTAHDGDAQQ